VLRLGVRSQAAELGVRSQAEELSAVLRRRTGPVVIGVDEGDESQPPRTAPDFHETGGGELRWELRIRRRDKD
jgi:hypothetical protein